MNEPAQDSAVTVKGLYKLFGGDIDAGLQMARQGAEKQEIERETGSVLALSDISFEAVSGEIFVVMGLSGCGKSTLGRCINRLIEPTAGEVWIGSEEVSEMDEDELRQLRRRSVSMVFQHYGLLPHRTVMDNVGLGLELSGIEGRERHAKAEEALETVGLGGWGSRMPSELSGGMKQRVGLARALAHNSPVLLMDEPFSALDPLIRHELQEELSALQEEMRKTIIFVTHDLDEAVRIGDRVMIMHDGRIAQIGTPSEVVLSPANSYVRDFTKEVRQYALLTSEMVMSEANHVVHKDALAIQVLRDLIASDQNYSLVVDDLDRYMGTALVQRIESVMPDGKLTIGDTPLLMEEGVASDVVLDDLVPLGLRSAHSIPVLNDEGVLLGEVLLESLAAAMDA